MQKYQNKVDVALIKYLTQGREYPAVIYRAMRYSVFAGGKRLRPILALLAAKACGVPERRAMPAACALEMIHTYSLIHDDLPAMDDDDLRRGKPTSHKKFGEAIAILAGDALLTKAFETVLCARVEPQLAVEAASEIARASGVSGMVGGQALDMESGGKRLGKKELDILHSKKTGALITASLVSGAILAGADTVQRRLFRNFGGKLGLAFQITDDILDVTGNEKQMGKRLRKDKSSGKNTYPAIYGLKESRKKAEQLVVEARAILGKIKGDISGLEQVAQFVLDRYR
ncbi:MAG: polyprenyl synthetase family protein [Spirochaetia bacterium]|nr:polyprenyl synthetase family protein [Spirochaetia bacterium]